MRTPSHNQSHESCDKDSAQDSYGVNEKDDQTRNSERTAWIHTR